MKPNFGFFVIALCVGLLPEYGAFAKSEHCDYGEFFMTKNCSNCPAGCYCPYISGNRMQLDIEDEISSSQLADWCAHKINQCDKPKKSNKYYNEYQECGRNDKAQVFRCPEQFPNSAGGSTSIEQCYTVAGPKKLYYKKITCVSGEYLPINSDTCVPCKTGTSDYCPGLKDVYPSITIDQGIKTCTSGQHANGTHTTCENASDGKIKCVAGTYLPANAEECAACPDGFVCRGNAYSKQPIDQGNEECPNGTVPNRTKTECETDPDNISVPRGYYLPANYTTPQPCENLNRKQFCPGGTFAKSSLKQGIIDCPLNSNANENHTGCKLQLTMDQMKYGVATTKTQLGECWTKTDPEDYRYCIYGTRF